MRPAVARTARSETSPQTEIARTAHGLAVAEKVNVIFTRLLVEPILESQRRHFLEISPIGREKECPEGSITKFLACLFPISFAYFSAFFIDGFRKLSTGEHTCRHAPAFALLGSFSLRRRSTSSRRRDKLSRVSSVPRLAARTFSAPGTGPCAASTRAIASLPASSCAGSIP